MIIGLPNDTSDKADILNLIDADFTFVEIDFDIQNGIPKTNVDAILLDGTYTLGASNYSILKSLGVPILGQPRLSKLEQHIYFRSRGINCPDFWNTSSKNGFRLTSLMEGVDPETQLIVKSQFGARGLQQFLIKKSELVRIMYDGEAPKKKEPFSRKESPSVELLEIKTYRDEVATNSILGGSEKPEDISRSRNFRESRDFSNWLITKRIFLKNEYRVISFCTGELLICERHINLKHFQNNLAVGSEVTFLGEGETLKSSFLALLKALAGTLHTDFRNNPWFSMDVYVDQDDKVGLFEFATEFGINALDHDMLRAKAIKAIHSLVPNRSSK